MPKSKLTDISVRALKAPATGQVTYWDESERGFGVRVSQGGSKTFIFMHGGQRRRITIGRFPDMKLAKARAQAKALRSQFTLKLRQASIPFDEGLELFFATHCANNRASTNSETMRILRKRFLPVFKSRDLSDIGVQEISAIIDPILRAGKPSAANHAFMEIRKFYRWAVRRSYVRHSPCESLQLPTRPVERDRVLSDEELRCILNVALKSTSQYALIVRLLAFSGQRRNEIVSLAWPMINESERTITLPASVTKNKREHTFPYGAMAADVFTCLTRGDGLLFPARDRDTPFCGWSKAKRVFDQACEIAPWTLHDLRRTFSTNLSRLGVQPHVTERLLNHVSGQISGVAAIYNRWSYLPEMRDAMCRYEDHLKQLVAA